MIATNGIESSHALYALAAGELLLYVLLIWIIVVFRLRMKSWKVLRRYSPLFPVIIIYLYYVLNPITFSGMILQRAYLCILPSVAHWGVIVLLIDRKALRWALSSKEEREPVFRSLAYYDMVAFAGPTLLIFMLMWFALADLASTVHSL